MSGRITEVECIGAHSPANVDGAVVLGIVLSIVDALVLPVVISVDADGVLPVVVITILLVSANVDDSVVSKRIQV